MECVLVKPLDATDMSVEVVNESWARALVLARTRAAAVTSSVRSEVRTFFIGVRLRV